jgi:tetratricopeptide (TPR) repeat protein
VKRTLAALIILISLLVWSCATYQPPPPNLYTGELPQSIVTDLSLDERIQVEDAWKSIKVGNTKNAQKIIEKLGSESPFYYVGMGYVAYLLGNPQTAEQYFKASLSYFPDVDLAHYGLAQVYQDSNNVDSVFSEYREILKIDSDNPWAKPRYEEIKERKTGEALTEAKTFLSAGDTENSKGSFLRALYYSPDSTEAHLALGKIYRDESNFQNALLHLKAANAEEPQDTDIRKTYADTLFQAGELKNSLGVYEDLLEQAPGDQEVRDRLETIKNRLGIFELPSQYNAIQSTESVTKEDVAALLSVKFKNILDEQSGKPPIIIDISTSWASRFILHTASLGILDVYPNHTFQPKKVITRAEMSEILFRLIEHLKRKGYNFIQQIPPNRIQISDVSPSNYYYRSIILLVSYDIMTLAQDREFNPDQAVSGREATRLLDLILALIK